MKAKGAITRRRFFENNLKRLGFNQFPVKLHLLWCVCFEQKEYGKTILENLS